MKELTEMKAARPMSSARWVMIKQRLGRLWDIIISVVEPVKRSRLRPVAQ